MERLIPVISEYLQELYQQLVQPELALQLLLIALIYAPASLLGRKVEPLLEAHARKIKDSPALLRLIIAFLRRLKWFFYATLLAVVYALTTIAAWPKNNYPVYAAMLLVGAWLFIAVVSYVIRSRVLGRVFAFVAWSFVAATILGISDDIGQLLDTAGFSVGSYRLSALTVLQGAIVFSILMWVAINLGDFLDRRIQKIDELTPSLRVLIGKVTRISLLVFAILVAISSIGIDLTALTVFSGAVGVGIGFGLQKVVSNFISGIIILMDQSIKPGDTISLGETFGWIRELRARFVSVVTRDGREFLIPNEDFITTQVINWSFSDQYVRLDVPFGVSYNSDPHEVTKLAIEAAGRVDRVDSTRNPPVCWMTAFGDSSLDFLLRFWIRDPQAGLTNVRGKVLLALWDTFKEHDINIPFPHREIIMRSPVEVETKKG